MEDHGYTPDVTLHFGAVVEISRKLYDRGACKRWTLDDIIQCGKCEAHEALSRWYDPERARVSTFLYRVLPRRIVRAYQMEFRLPTKAGDWQRPEHIPMSDLGGWFDGKRVDPQSLSVSREADPFDAAVAAEERELADATVRMLIGEQRSETTRHMLKAHIFGGESATSVNRRLGLSHNTVGHAVRTLRRRARVVIQTLEGE